MKTLSFLICLLMVSPLMAKKTNKKKSDLKREFNFNDMSLVGNYKKLFGSNIVVEDEKSLDDLLGVRKHFKDRVKTEAKRKSL